MKKMCLCIIGLLFVGTLCVPVAADTGDQDYWSFYMVDRILAHYDVKLNGHSSGHAAFYMLPQKVYVSNSLDQIEVLYEVVGGPDTTLTITKEYVNKLREKRPDWDPALIAWGGSLTYDVDGGWFKLPAGQKENYTLSRYFIRPHEHLVSRGLSHSTLESNIEVYQSFCGKVDVFYVRD